MSSLHRIISLLENIVGRGRATEREGGGATITARGGERIFARRAQPYGFASRPPSGECFFISIGGNRSDNVALMIDAGGAAEDLAAGEIEIWNAAGAKIRLLANGGIRITGDVEVSGNITAMGDVRAGEVSLTTHTHGCGSGETPPPSVP